MGTNDRLHIDGPVLGVTKRARLQLLRNEAPETPVPIREVFGSHRQSVPSVTDSSVHRESLAHDVLLGGQTSRGHQAPKAILVVVDETRLVFTPSALFGHLEDCEAAAEVVAAHCADLREKLASLVLPAAKRKIDH